MNVSSTPRVSTARVETQEPPKLDKFSLISISNRPYRKLSAEMNLDAFDSQSQQNDVPLNYLVSAVMDDDGKGRLYMLDVNVRPQDGTYDYRHRPGTKGTASLKQALMRALASEYPEAKTVSVRGRRVTTGFKGKTIVKLEFPLAPYREG